MKASLLVFLVFLAFIVCGPARAGSDGRITDDSPCEAVSIDYDEFVADTRAADIEERAQAKEFGVDVAPFEEVEARVLTREEFTERKAAAGYECRRIRYLSDGMEVVGHLFKPIATQGKHLPLIIYIRGGNREFSKNAPLSMLEFHDYLQGGYVVLASQYRGNDGGEGREEFGGADVNDVLNLIPLARSLDYIDMNNVFMYGVSRGAMMTYLAIKQGMRVNAAAVVGGTSDLEAEAERRPGLAEINHELIPNFAQNRQRALRDRSVVHWAHTIDVPMLILHGGADWRVDPTEALKLAENLQEANRTYYELVIYAQDDHPLSMNRANRAQHIMSWFRRHAAAL